jgi:NAD+ diphosphatase
MPDHMPFTGDPLDRAGNLRHDPKFVAEAFASPQGRYLPFWRLSVLVHESDAPALLWLGREVRGLLPDGPEPVLLGLRDGLPHFAIDLSPLADPLAAIEAGEGARFAEVREMATRLPPQDSGTIAHARSLLDWHVRHRFCSSCGAATSPREGGSCRKCDACGAEHFPRTDPVVIMVVWRGDRCLLGTRRNSPGAFYSALAGFIDQGESIEEAVRREVKEEAGVEVDEVVYHASQPWPFPSSLMIGCFAHATSDDAEVDDLELENVRWFTRQEVRRAVFSPGEEAGFSIPGRVAIAHHLIKAWCQLSEEDLHARWRTRQVPE